MKPAATAKVTLLLNCAPSSSGVKGIFSRTRTKGPNEQKLLEEDGCSANDFVAAHITEATIIISFLTECFNKVPLKAMVKFSLISKGTGFHNETQAQVFMPPAGKSAAQGNGT